MDDVTAEPPLVESLGDHDYLIRVLEGDEAIEIRVHASPAVLASLGTVDADENRLIEATAAYLIARQRADDLPSSLDLEDVAAAYEGYLDAMTAQLGDR